MGGELDTRDRDRRVAALASRQRGLATRPQLVALGLTHRVIDDWIARGRLHGLHRGVYAVGHGALAPDARWLAAVMACGADAVLSHRPAGAHWELRRVGSGPVDVTVPGTAGRMRRSGIAVHRSGTLRSEDVTVHRGIPVTSLARTLVDLAALVRPAELERMLDQADVMRRLDLAAIQAVADAHPSLVGSRRIRTVLGAYAAGASLTRSELEALVLSICTDAGLPRPEVNRRVAGLEVDFLWRGQRLVAEADSRRYHATRRAFERDRERDAILLLHGYRVVRLTERRLTTDAVGVAQLLSALLVSTSPPHGW